MAQGRYKTNPKKIIQLESKYILLSLKRDDLSSIISFDFRGLNPDIKSVYGYNTIDDNSSMILEISSKKDTQRVELGTIKAPKTIVNHSFDIEGSLSQLSYRFFIISNFEVKASCEKVIPSDVERSDERSLINVEAEDLGEILWRIEPYDGKTEPIIKVNNISEIEMKLFLETDYGRALIFQNAFEQILRILLKSDETADWVKNWHIFFDNEGIEIPEVDEERCEKDDGIDETVRTVSKKWNLITKHINSKVRM